MTPGEKLAETIDALELAKINSKRAQANADMEKIRIQRERRSEYLDKLEQYFYETIEAGKVPYKKETNYTHESWIKAARDGKASNQDLWDQFSKRLATQKLRAVVKEQDDGMGMKSWITITVDPIRPGTR